MIVYKVVRRDGAGLTSVSQHHPHTFEPRQVTVSINAPLFVFTNLGHAKIWARSRPGTEVWKAEVDYAWDIQRIIHNMEPALNNPSMVEAWWRNEIQLKTQPVPLYTQVTPALKLLERLYPAAGDRDSPVWASDGGRA